MVRHGFGREGVSNFAKEYTGLSFREAHAIHAKYDFWCVRTGVMRYNDEAQPGATSYEKPVAPEPLETPDTPPRPRRREPGSDLDDGIPF